VISKPRNLLHIVVRAPATGALERWIDLLPVKPDLCAFPEQLHSASVRRREWPGIVPGIDGLWSHEIPLAIRTADCVPVFVCDPLSGLRALIHAGRQGIATGIVEESVSLLQKAGHTPQRFRVWLGPRIGPCCYQFERDHPLASVLVKELPHGSCLHLERLKLDLSKEILTRFLNIGVNEKHIGVDRRCTSCHTMRLPSHRRDGPSRRRALLTLSWKPETTGDNQMNIDPELLKILACPETKEPVSLAPAELIEKLNNLIEQGGIKNRGGEDVTETMDAGLIREDGRFLYPIRDDIPVMLIDEAIEIPPLSLN
jgi:YfiH family protein